MNRNQIQYVLDTLTTIKGSSGVETITLGRLENILREELINDTPPQPTHLIPEGPGFALIDDDNISLDAALDIVATDSDGDTVAALRIHLSNVEDTGFFLGEINTVGIELTEEDLRAIIQNIRMNYLA